MTSSLFRALHPRRFLEVLEEIDCQSHDPRISRAKAQRQAAPTLLVVAICLLIIHYMKFNLVFKAALRWTSGAMGLPPDFLINALASTGFEDLIGDLWWGLWHLIGYVLIPFLFIRFGLGRRIADFGLGLGDVRQHLKWYLVLLTPILVFVVLVSFRDDFSTHYPFYHLASRSWFDLLAWELIYLSQFVFLEFFFRGFILQSLKPAFGVNAIFVMCIPYLMIHFPKPWLEATGAILFGLFLGVLAMRSRSIWGGVAVHAGVAVSMDIAALVQTRGLPVKWWPF